MKKENILIEGFYKMILKSKIKSSPNISVCKSLSKHASSIHRGRGATLKVGGLTSDSKWGGGGGEGAENTFFSVTL